MTRLEKCELLKEKGYTYNPETGKIYGVKGTEIIRKNKNGYILINNKNMKGQLLGHHFAWYMIYNHVDFDRLDHRNTNPNDNRISNLRILTHQQNMFNTKAKGITWDKVTNKWMSKITLNGKTINLGRYEKEEEARQAYLSAKSIYHPLI